MSVTTSSASKVLVERYEEAVKSKDATKMKNWRRSLSRYCSSREAETGTPAIRYRAAIKSRLTKSGYDVSAL
jgi:hypothetical protein